MGVFNILPYQQEQKRWTPYLYAGVAGFYFNPKAQFKGQWVELQPLGTEGQGLPTEAYTQRKKYNRYQVAIPFGFGFKFSFSKHISVALELGARKTFTDYIDDVSLDYVSSELLEKHNGNLAAELSNRTYTLEGDQVDLSGSNRGSLKGADWYFVSGFSLSYTITKPQKKERTKKYKYQLNKWL